MDEWLENWLDEMTKAWTDEVSAWAGPESSPGWYALWLRSARLLGSNLRDGHWSLERLAGPFTQTHAWSESDARALRENKMAQRSALLTEW